MANGGSPKRSVLAMKWMSVVLGAFLFGVASEDTRPPAEVSLTIHRRGHALEPPPDAAAEATGLVLACERQLSAAEAVLRLAVSKEQIRALRDEEVVLELRYPSPRSFVLEARDGRTIKADALLIPLTGTFAEGGVTTIFVHLGSWKPGPYRKTDGLSELTARLGDLGLPSDTTD